MSAGYPYPILCKIIGNISADNGGCSADEWEEALADFTEEELWTLAAGEDTERKALIERIAQRTNPIIAKSFDEFLDKAFDA